MPVEYVRGAGFDPEKDAAECMVKVAWGHQYVQVAAIARSFETHETLVTDTESWYVDLDRKGINDLIKRLRHARDRAYGKDA